MLSPFQVWFERDMLVVRFSPHISESWNSSVEILSPFQEGSKRVMGYCKCSPQATTVMRSDPPCPTASLSFSKNGSIQKVAGMRDALPRKGPTCEGWKGGSAH